MNQVTFYQVGSSWFINDRWVPSGQGVKGELLPGQSTAARDVDPPQFANLRVWAPNKGLLTGAAAPPRPTMKIELTG